MFGIRVGSSRWVLLVGRLAIKVPRMWPPSRIASGLRANEFERLVMRRYAPAFGWRELCPVLWADRFGLLLLMPRTEPVSQVDVYLLSAAVLEHHPAPPCEMKAEHWGRLPDGRIVAVEFAESVHDADDLREHRDYLESALRGREVAA